MAEPGTKLINPGGLILGLLLTCFALVPVLCAGDVVCKPRRGGDEYPIWYMAVIVAPFVLAGITLAAQALGLRVLSALVGLGVPVSFALLLHALQFVAGANSCAPGSITLRLAVNLQFLPTTCKLWPTLLGFALDSLLLGLTLEALRRGLLGSPWKERLEPLVKWLVLLPLAPLLVLFVPIFLMIAGQEMLRALWQRLRS